MRLVLAAIALLTLSRAAAAQVPEPRPGQYIRVWSLDTWASRREGLLVAIDSSTLRMQRGGGSAIRVVPLDSVRRIDVRIREGSHLAGAKRGALAGAVLLGGLIVLWRSDYDGAYEDAGTAFGVAYGTPLFVATGALLGSLTKPGGTWRRVR